MIGSDPLVLLVIFNAILVIPNIPKNLALAVVHPEHRGLRSRARKGASTTIWKTYRLSGFRNPMQLHLARKGAYPFVDGFIKKKYPRIEKEMFNKLSQTQPTERMGRQEEIADLAVYLCSDEVSFITGV